MTTPTATNTDPALRARIATALTGIGEEAGEVIARVGERAAGRLGPAAGIMSYGVTSAQIDLSRPLTDGERVALHACIRAHLEAGAAPAHPSPAEMAREAIRGTPADYGGANGCGDYERVGYAKGIAAERIRLRATLIAMAESGTADRTHVAALAEGLR